MPPDLTPKFQLAGQYLSQGKYEQARLAFQRILQVAPGHPDANNGMAIALTYQAQADKALYFARRAVEARPDDTALENTLANILRQLGRAREALDLVRRIVARPDTPLIVRSTLTNALWDADECLESVEYSRALLKDGPEAQMFAFQVAPKLALVGRVEEGVDLCRAAMPTMRNQPDLHRSLAAALVNDARASAGDVLDAHRGLAECLERTARVPLQETSPPRDPERRVRVGLVSTDFRRHSVAYFVDAILRHLDRARFHVTCYSAVTREDDVTASFRALADAWTSLNPLDDAQAAERIARDGIDILIDLNGHTTGGRLGVLRRRPAPVQVTYCGYPATTGLPAIDYRVVDATTDPPGSESHCTERLVRLDPCFLCYSPPGDLPPVSPAPAATSGHVTFGSFNATSKLNEPLLDLWSRVMREVPGSRLALKAASLVDPRLREDLAARFVARGVGRERLDLLPPHGPLREHLDAYSRVDVALDPFPYHGTTTTCEALLMGVPVVTRAGVMHAGRVGVSLLRAVGLGELIASDEDGYVALAHALAKDVARLSGLRATLRGRLLASPLCDAPAFAARFGQALRTIWKDACARYAPGPGARPPA